LRLWYLRTFLSYYRLKDSFNWKPQDK